MTLLALHQVAKTFRRDRTAVYAVNGVTLDIGPGETLGLIGESGAGKSTVGRLALYLQEPDSGRVTFNGNDLSTLGPRDLRAMRARMTVVFQEPYQSLNPRMKIRDIVEEPLRIHEPQLSRRERSLRIRQTLEHVALPNSLAERYPHELSGGQQQRVGIARAIITMPQFIVLDEPTSSLDLSVRAQVLELLASLQSKFNLAYLFISHDVDSVRHLSSRVGVMYLGQIVELGPTEAVCAAPRHPYTQALLSASLSIDPECRPQRLRLAGEYPSPTELPAGCPLVGRCPIEIPPCATTAIELRPIAPDHSVACIRAA